MTESSDPEATARFVYPLDPNIMLALLERKARQDLLAQLAKNQLVAMTQACAFEKSEAILEKIGQGKCEDVTIEELAAAIRLKQWLGDSDWDDTGRGSELD